MHRRIVVTLAVVAVSALGITGCQKKEAPEQAQAPATAPAQPAQAPGATPPAATSTAATGSGEQLYKQHCAACHPDGGNTMNAKKTLHSADMAANNVKTSDDIVKLMRNPGQGMPKFDEKAIPDKDAKAIAEYILATFK